MELLNKYTANENDKKGAVYIGRGSPLGNPYVIGKHGTRDEVIEMYRHYLDDAIKRQEPVIMSALSALTDNSKLLCFCHPRPCHGSVIEAAYRRIKESNMSTQNTYQVIEGSPLDSPFNDVEAITPKDRIDQYRKYLVRKLVYRDPSVENVFRRLTLETEITGHKDFRNFNLGVVLELLSTIQKYTTYEEALSALKRQYSVDLIDYRPEDDGKTHINVFSKGKTQLGQLLSNFAHTPFEHPEYGHFASIEAFWYWLSTGKTCNELRSLYGFNSKKEGRMLRDAMEKQGTLPVIQNFKVEIKKALMCKIQQNEALRETLKASHLPLTHYYYWGEGDQIRVSYPQQYAWIHEYLSDLRDWLQGKAYRLVIAGSRSITDYSEVEKAYDEAGMKAVEIVSGCAPGVDRLGEKLAERLELPVRLFPAKWDEEGKSAGFTRNRLMSIYGDAGLLLWDGVSKGTPHMEKMLVEREKPCKKILVSPSPSRRSASTPTH